MPKQITKTEVIARLQTERERLEKNLALLSRDEMLMPGVVGEWSVKDVLAHLADWEGHMLTWMEAARQGDPVDEIEPGLNWKQFHEFNQRIYERHRSQSLDEILKYFNETHNQFMFMVAIMPEEEMFDRGRYKFIGKEAVYNWLNSYARHDAWGKNHIRKWLKAQGKL